MLTFTKLIRMKTTLLANKKLNSFVGITAKNKFEIYIRSKLLYQNLPEKNGFVECTTQELWLIAYRAWYYGISIIGIESNIDQDVPFYDLCIEDYVSNVVNFGEQNPTQWILSAAFPIIQKHTGIQLKFYIDVPEINIAILEKTIGMNLNTHFPM